MSHSIAALRALSDEQLIREHDDVARNTGMGTDYYMEELDRRSRERSTEASNRLARQGYRLSVVTIILSIVATAVAVIALFRPSGA